MTYIRNSWSNQASPVAPELVAAVRSHTDGRRNAFQVASLDAFAAEFTAPDTAATAEAEASGAEG
jgi:hypothetical protein